MIEPISVACRSCGAPVDEAAGSRDGLCPQCAAAWLASWTRQTSGAVPQQPSPQQNVVPQPSPYGYPNTYGVPHAPYQPYHVEHPDPDRPVWGVWSGIGVWVFSIAALLVVQTVIVFLLYALDQHNGLPVPSLVDREAMTQWMMSPRVVAASVYATIGAHLLTVAFCWAVVTRFNERPFFSSLGWNWAGRPPLVWLLIGVAVFIGINLANAFFIRVLPQKPSPFDDMLKSGPQVRLAVALLASFSAPLVEEIVYRGVIFGALRKRFSAATTVIVVMLLFTGVHVPQYVGAWATIAGLTVLSLALTIVRAQSKSLLPSIVIHFVNNAVISLFLVFGKSTDF